MDGSFQYLFPVEDAILAVAKHTDLIYIFFDPIGQALCKRTMTAVERLNERHAEKLHYYMSKADQVEKEHDRQRGQRGATEARIKATREATERGEGGGGEGRGRGEARRLDSAGGARVASGRGGRRRRFPPRPGRGASQSG